MHPFHPDRCHTSKVFVCVSEEVCCGLLNGHSRWWQAPRQASAGLEHTPSGKSQPLLYQPMTAWPRDSHLLTPFLCLSACLSLSLFFFLSKEVDPLNFLTNFRCPGSAVKGLSLCGKMRFICSCSRAIVLVWGHPHIAPSVHSREEMPSGFI